MRLSNKYSGLQFFAPPISGLVWISVDGDTVDLSVVSLSWADNETSNCDKYVIKNEKVIWFSNSGILQLNGVDVNPSDTLEGSSDEAIPVVYTTRGGVHQ